MRESSDPDRFGMVPWVFVVVVGGLVGATGRHRIAAIQDLWFPSTKDKCYQRMLVGRVSIVVGLARIESGFDSSRMDFLPILVAFDITYNHKLP